MSLTATQADVHFAARIHDAVLAAGFTSTAQEGVGFSITFEDNTQLVVGVKHSVFYVARVMPNGNMVAQSEFRGFPVDFVAAAVVAMAKEA